MTQLIGQADMGTVETATKLFGPMGAVCVILLAALVHMFRLYHTERNARIEDAKKAADLLPYVAKILRRLDRLQGREAETSDHPPPISRARISDRESEP